MYVRDGIDEGGGGEQGDGLLRSDMCVLSDMPVSVSVSVSVCDEMVQEIKVDTLCRERGNRDSNKLILSSSAHMDVHVVKVKRKDDKGEEEGGGEGKKINTGSTIIINLHIKFFLVLLSLMGKRGEERKKDGPMNASYSDKNQRKLIYLCP